MKNIIKNYLSGARCYAEGVALYERYGRNTALRRAFLNRPESRMMRLTLYEELRRLAGLSVYEFEHLERHVTIPGATPPPVEPHLGTSDTPAVPHLDPVSPKECERIRFRDRFTFLKSKDCPDVLKLLVNDMFASYDAYREAHNTLAGHPDDAPMDDTAPLAATAVEEYLNDRQIWEELTHYQENGTLLGNHPKVAKYLKWQEYKTLTDFNLVQRRKNAASNISKYRAKITAATSDEDRLKLEAQMREWITVKELCDHEIEQRKKGA